MPSPTSSNPDFREIDRRAYEEPLPSSEGKRKHRDRFESVDCDKHGIVDDASACPWCEVERLEQQRLGYEAASQVALGQLKEMAAEVERLEGEARAVDRVTASRYRELEAEVELLREALELIAARRPDADIARAALHPAEESARAGSRFERRIK